MGSWQEAGSPWRNRGGGGDTCRRWRSGEVGVGWLGGLPSVGHEEGRGALDFGNVGAEGRCHGELRRWQWRGADRILGAGRALLLL